MAWFGGKVSLGGFPDLAGAVNKLSESVKNVEKNFDNALGLEENSDSSGETSGLWPMSTDRKTLFDPVTAFMGNKGDEISSESSQPESLLHPSPTGEREFEADRSHSTVEQTWPAEEENEVLSRKESEHHDSAGNMSASTVEKTGSLGEEIEVPKTENEHLPTVADKTNSGTIGINEAFSDSQLLPVEQQESTSETLEKTVSFNEPQQNESFKTLDNLPSMGKNQEPVDIGQAEHSAFLPVESQTGIDLNERMDEQKMEVEEIVDKVSQAEAEPPGTSHAIGTADSSPLDSASTGETDNAAEFSESRLPGAFQSDETLAVVCESTPDENNAIIEKDGVIQQANDNEAYNKEHCLTSAASVSDSDSAFELEKVRMEMKMMESALQGAAKQAQAKADEIGKLMNENEKLKSIIEGLKKRPNETEIESLREEYHQRVAALERKVYALTKERDTLRREQNKKSSDAALLKEKDEIISQVMAEGEELSKKQAAQESQIRKLRAQIREFEEEKKGLLTKLQVEENKVESIKRDKVATEKLLQETIEKHQVELSAQKESFTNTLTAAKEAEALAETRANNEARIELESRLRDAEEHEALLVQALEELRETLSRKEQQAVFREDMLRKDIEDLQKRYQASERRCEELIIEVPESTRPLLRQIEAMQETTSRRAEAWAAVERSLNSRLQEAEGKVAAAEERERSINERLSQTLSRINVLEAQISCLRAEQTQLSRSLEKERQRAAENRQEYLVAKEAAETLEGRASQLEEELRELRRKHKEELQDAFANRELLRQDLEREKTTRMDLERAAQLQSSTVSDQTPTKKLASANENGNLTRRISSASSLGSMEESYFLQASLDSSDSFSDRRNLGEITMTPYYMKSMTPGAFEAALRQKEGELASYISRLASVESIRDSLAEELVKMTAQCEKLRAESATLPGLRAELEALRRRHSSALELMGERDEELEELRADITDLKDMYKEQVDLLVNKIQILGSSMSTTVV